MYLTQRELEICKCIAIGMNNNEIAKQMFISEHTVKWHISAILNHNGIANRTQLAYILGKKNIINM